MATFDPRIFGRFWHQEASNLGPRASLRSLVGLRKATKTQVFGRFVVWKHVKLVASHKTNKKSDKRALECSGPIGATPEEPNVAPKWGPRASLEDPCGAHKSYKHH